MNTDIKKLLLIFGGGLVIFWAFQKLKPIGGSKTSSKTGKKKKSENSPEQKKNAVIMLKAFTDAKSAGENSQFLNEMNQEFVSKYQMKVIGDKTTKKYIVVDTEGNKVI